MKRAEARMRKKGLLMYKGSEKKIEREKMVVVLVERTEIWYKKGFATTSETRPHKGRLPGCQRVLGGI